jgi:hypothetical protein
MSNVEHASRQTRSMELEGRERVRVCSAWSMSWTSWMLWPKLDVFVAMKRSPSTSPM